MSDCLLPTAVFPLHDPPEGSVLGRIVTDESSLELLVNIDRVTAIGRSMEELRAEIEAERKQQHAERLQAFLTLREDAALRCRHVVCITKFGSDEDIPNRGKLVPTQPLAPNCKHGLLLVSCAACKEQNDGGLVDARRTARRYNLRKQHKKDPATKGNFPCVADDSPERLSHILQALFRAEPRFKQVTPEDVDWAERQTSLRSIPIDARSKRCCPICDLSRKKTALAQGKYICDSHGNPSLKTTPADNRPQVRQVVTPNDRRRNHVEMLMESIFSQAAHMRELPKMLDVDCHELVMSDVETKGYEDAVRHLKARSRWLTEMRIEHKGGPEARSFKAIVTESRFSPTLRS